MSVSRISSMAAGLPSANTIPRSSRIAAIRWTANGDCSRMRRNSMTSIAFLSEFFEWRKSFAANFKFIRPTIIAEVSEPGNHRRRVVGTGCGRTMCSRRSYRARHVPSDGAPALRHGLLSREPGREGLTVDRSPTLAPAVSAVTEGRQQQRHVVVLGGFGDLELHGNLRIERRLGAALGGKRG